MYEGAPDWPQKDRFWEIIERHGVTIFYTAPTAIRAFMRGAPSGRRSTTCRSLRLLGSVGEPINPEAWIWYHRYIGGERCPIVDTWWQTETGAIMITPLPGITTHQAGLGDAAVPGISAEILNDKGEHGRASAAGCWRSRGRGRRCCAASTAIPSATCSSTGAAGRRTSTSPATAPSATTTATSGCSAASTTC